jgi:hypothetical protein
MMKKEDVHFMILFQHTFISNQSRILHVNPQGTKHDHDDVKEEDYNEYNTYQIINYKLRLWQPNDKFKLIYKLHI